MRITTSVSMSVRTNLALHHLRSSARAARDAYDVEQANLNTPFGPWFDNMMVSVPVAIVMAGAALEANANEIVQDILDGSTKLVPSKGGVALLRDLKADRSEGAMEKYWRLALMFDKEPDLGGPSWQDAQSLVDFRNKLMHFKPAWHRAGETNEDRLVKTLKPKVPIARGYEINFQFPNGFMTYGCAKWAVRSFLAFSAYYNSLMDLKDKLIPFHADLVLP
jgi:hypothetical protein